MIVMIFEFAVIDVEMADYLAHSASLREHLAGIEGFLSVERFASTATPGRFVAIGYFTDEDAVRRWRNLPEHRRAQSLGRSRYFSGYRLVMAEALRDYSHDLRSDAPGDSKTFHRNAGERHVRS